MAEVDLIGVPFDGYGRAGHQAAAATVLREAGLAEVWSTHHEVASDEDLRLPPPDAARGSETSLLNERGVLAVAHDLASAVETSLGAGRFPMVFGGDCTVLLGIAPALLARGGHGLMFVDGHEDTMPLDVSEDGEAANTELGLLLGITGRTLERALCNVRGTLDARRLAVIGTRDHAWRARFNVASLSGLGVWLTTATGTAPDPGGTGAAAVAHLRRADPRWWMHLDLDVVDPAEFAAQGLPDVADEPGGLTWGELESLVTSAVAAGGCVGVSAVIYDPDQDPGREDARRIVQLLAAIAAAL